MSKRTLVIACLLLGAVLGCAAQKNTPQRVLTRFERTGTTLDGWDWASQPWTGDNKPYQQLRVSIYNEIAARQDPERLIARYKTQAQTNSKDPLAQFAWAYAALRVPSFEGDTDVQVDTSELPDALAAAPFPRTYDYARLRFLAQAQERPMPQLEDLGRRLLKRNPTDVPVKYQQIRVLRRTPSRTQNAEALRLANSLAEAYPSQLVYIQTVGNVHEDAYTDFGFHKADAEAAIAAYQKYLQLAPPNDAMRGELEEVITIMRRYEL